MRLVLHPHSQRFAVCFPLLVEQGSSKSQGRLAHRQRRSRTSGRRKCSPRLTTLRAGPFLSHWRARCLTNLQQSQLQARHMKTILLLQRTRQRHHPAQLSYRARHMRHQMHQANSNNKPAHGTMPRTAARALPNTKLHWQGRCRTSLLLMHQKRSLHRRCRLCLHARRTYLRPLLQLLRGQTFSKKIRGGPRVRWTLCRRRYATNAPQLQRNNQWL